MTSASGRKRQIRRDTADTDGAAATAGPFHEAVLRASTDVLFVRDAHRRFRYISPSATEVLGWTPDDFVALEFDIFHPDDRGQVERLSRRIREEGAEVDRVRVRVRTKDRAFRWMDLTATNHLTDPDVRGLIVNLRDVTGEMEAEERAGSTVRRFQSLVEHARDVILVVGADLAIRYASGSTSEVLLTAPSEVMGSHALDFVHPDDRDAAVDRLAGLLRGDAVARIILRLIRGDGSTAHMEIVGEDMRNRPEVGGIVLNLRDVTDRVRAEHRLQALFSKSADVIQVLDRRGMTTEVWGDVQRLVGYSADELVGGDTSFLLDEADVGPVRAAIAEVLSGGEGAERRVEAKVRTRGGSLRWIDSIITNRCDDETIGGVICTIRDVTERVRTTIEMERLTEVLGATNDLVTITDREMNLLWANAAARSAFGLDADEDLSTFDLASTADSTLTHRFQDDVLPSLRESGFWTGEFGYLHDGELIPTSATFIAHRGEDGRTQFVSSVSRDIRDRKRLQAELEHQASHDTLTGLPNRSLLELRISDALDRGHGRPAHLAVFFLDLDKFKIVNDSLGHTLGDHLLVEVADRLRRVVRPGDVVARFGGDEFVVLCEDLRSREDGLAVADRIVDGLSGTFRIDGRELSASVSVGVAFSRGDEEDAASLVRDADVAMYVAKELGRNRRHVFDETLRDRAVHRLDTQRELRQALAADQLMVHYQPVIEVATHELLGFEALVRWDHPERGEIGPVEFIGLAEDTGLIVDLGAWMIDRVLGHLRAWNHRRRRPLTASINLSGRQLNDPALTATLADALERTGLDPATVVLEITESVVMENAAATTTRLNELKSLGIRLAVDDFGTGYSSLAYLRRFPVDILKVDREFVGGLGVDDDDSEIVAAIIHLAHSLGLAAVAEGVEEERQLREIERLGCDQAQGYLIGRPVDVETASAMTTRWAGNARRSRSG